MSTYAKIFEALLNTQQSAGVTLSGGKVYFYAPGTYTEKTVYVDRNKSAPAANPYTLSAEGTAEVYGDGLYDIGVYDSTGVLKHFWEDVSTKDVGGDTVNADDFGGLAAAAVVSGAAGRTVVVTSPQVVTTAIAWPTDRALKFEGGYVTFTGSGALTGLKEARPEWFGIIDGVADDVQIELARKSVVDGLGGTLHLSGGYTISAPLVVSRGVRYVGKSMEATVINNPVNTPAFVFRKEVAAAPINAAIENLKIVGSANAAHTRNDGIECAGGAQYVSVRNLMIHSCGGIGLNFNDADYNGVIPLVGNLNGASSVRGMLYCMFDNITIQAPRGYGIYMTGNSAQNVFIKVRVVDSYGDAGVCFESNNLNAGVLCNTFVGGGVESGGLYNAPAGFKAVWFKGATLYAAHITKFSNFYIETGVSVALAATKVYGYYIEAARGVDINGGYISFCHEGVTAVSGYSDNIVISNVLFFNSDAFNGAGSLAGCYAVNKTNSLASLVLGAGNSFADSTTAGVWGTINPVQTVLGHTDIKNYLSNSQSSSTWVKGTSARVIGTHTGAGVETILLRTLKADATTEASRITIDGTVDLSTINVRTADIYMNGTDTGGAAGRIRGVHSQSFIARDATAVLNGYLFVDSADNKLKFKDSSGIVNLLY